MNSIAPPEVTGRKRVSRAKAAEIRGVCVRTIVRWEKAGHLPPAEMINRRGYHLLENVEAVGR